MIEYLLVILAFSIVGMAWLIHGLMNNRLEDKDKEIDEWSGVTDVKRDIDNRLANDSDYASSVRSKYNKAE